ncbi:MAG: hypothetical protein ABSC24_11690 [Verrucomicrobiota bacterium]|jgi:hypothetical protein
MVAGVPRYCQNGFAIVGFIGYLCSMTEVQHKRLRRIMKDALRIQDRFAAEPVLARTGKGYLKSEGVTTLQRIKAGLRKSAAH